jgi:outer membrane protein assembly factor BamE
MPMSIRQSSLILRCAPLLGALLLAACASKQPAPDAAAATTDGVQTVQERRILGFLTPYRPDVQQGNFVSQEMVDQLKVGMTPAQVRFVLGTPLLTDPFHADRWDYPFRLKKDDGEVISSRVTVHFENDRLARIEGGNLPAEEQFLDLLTGSSDTE